VEKLSTELARMYDLIGIEDLNVKAMTASARGTVDAPGVNVSAKASLNRGVLASGWGRFAQRLEDKAPGRVVSVRAAYTSQTCSVCGQVDANSRESQARFACTSCGYTGHADVNAACNIRDRALQSESAAGRAVAARRGAPVGSLRTANLSLSPS
jgi:putative transposase